MAADGAIDGVAAAGRAARAAHPGLAAAAPAAVAEAPGRAMSRLLLERADPVLSANARDVGAARAVLGDALLDRLRLDEDASGAGWPARSRRWPACPDIEQRAGSRSARPAAWSSRSGVVRSA